MDKRPGDVGMRLRALAALTLGLAGACVAQRDVKPAMRCPAGCTHCAPDGTCKDCTPGEARCVGDQIVACNADGTSGAVTRYCDVMHGERCAGKSCLSACDVAAASRSYIGCDYWPVTTLTAELNPSFDFAVAVANPAMIGDVVTGAAATVTVGDSSGTLVTRTVAAGAVEVIRLPWVPALSQNNHVEASVKVRDGAYHLVSSLPVTVYQFSPLEFEKPASKDCQDPGGSFDGMCHSFTADASLLLPTAALRSDYLVIARQTYSLTRPDPTTGKMVTTSTPGFLAVVGTQDDTTVEVTSSAFTDGSGAVTALKPGEKGSFTLDRGDVLEIVSAHATTPCAKTSKDFQGSYCDLGPSYDLTGTRIVSTRPVAVFGGHSCSFVPYDTWACDHLEQQMLPLDTWGRRIAVVQTEPQGAGEPNVWRIVSGSDGNSITFDPTTVHGPVSLDRGQYVELVAQGGFVVTGTGRTAVGQYMVGEQYSKDFSVMAGDPSLGLGVPIEQYRSSYDFLSPATYTKSYVNLIAPTAGAGVMLDGKALTDTFQAIGGSGYGYLRVQIPPGAHHVTGQKPFGITVSGVASFTSYLFPGGLNLDEIPLN